MEIRWTSVYAHVAFEAFVSIPVCHVFFVSGYGFIVKVGAVCDPLRLGCVPLGTHWLDCVCVCLPVRVITGSVGEGSVA